MARTMYVSVSDIMHDPDQTTVYNLQTDRRYIVEGCAGSGKSFGDSPIFEARKSPRP